MRVSDTNKNRGAHGDSSFKLGGMPSSSENPPALAVGSVKMCKRLGYTLVVNSMCERCAHFKNDCHGEANHVYTGCVARKVSRDVRAAL